MEHSYVRNNYVEYAGILLLDGNPWYKTRVIWAGDYGEDTDLLKGFEKEVKIVKKSLKEDNSYYKDTVIEDIPVNVYDLTHYVFNELPNPNKDVRYTLKNVVRYYYNDSKKEYFDVSNSPKSSGYGHRIHPLPLLTCECNHSGGSFHYDPDEYDYDKYISSWCGDIIFSSRYLLNGYTKIQPNFIEKW